MAIAAIVTWLIVFAFISKGAKTLGYAALVLVPIPIILVFVIMGHW
jgi:hypothetical protein